MWPAGNLVVSSPRCFPFFLSVLALDSLPQAAGCWRWLSPGTATQPRGAVSHQELWLQEEVPWGGQSGDGPSAHGWATNGARKAPGHELCLPHLVLRSTLGCCSQVLLQGGVESSSGALGGSPVGGFVLPCLCLCPGDRAGCVWGWTAVWGHVHVVWFVEICCLVPAG